VGNHDGMIKGKRFFDCNEAHGIFVKVDKVIPITGKGLRQLSKVLFFKKSNHFIEIFNNGIVY
jgi:dynactin complex subunit